MLSLIGLKFFFTGDLMVTTSYFSIAYMSYCDGFVRQKLHLLQAPSTKRISACWDLMEKGRKSNIFKHVWITARNLVCPTKFKRLFVDFIRDYILNTRHILRYTNLLGSQVSSRESDKKKGKRWSSSWKESEIIDRRCNCWSRSKDSRNL